MRGLQRARVIDFGDELGERREIEVALDQRRPHAEPRIGAFEQAPDRIDDRRAVRVDLEVGRFVVVAGDMHVGDALAGQRVEECVGVVAVIDAVDVDVVDVEQKIAVGFGEHCVDEVDLAHRLARRCVVRNVLDRDALAEDVLRLADAAGDVMHGFVRERNRHQVVEMPAVGAIGKVFGIDRDAVRVEQAADFREQRFVERIASAERERKAMADERMAFGERAQRAAEPAADADPVFRRDLEEIDRRAGHPAGHPAADPAGPAAGRVPHRRCAMRTHRAAIRSSRRSCLRRPSSCPCRRHRSLPLPSSSRRYP